MIYRVVNTNTLTVARSLFAFSFLLTLLFTPLSDLMPKQHLATLKENISGLHHLNYFLWFKNLTIPYLFSIFILFVVISGYRPRYTIFFQCWVSYSVYYSLLASEGGDQINAIMTLLLIPISILDGRVNGWVSQKKSTEKKFHPLLNHNAKISLLIMKIQVAALYFNASVSKMYAKEWINGSAVYYWFYDPTFGASKWIENIFGFLFKNDLTVSFINWGVIFLELYFFIALFLGQKHKHLVFLLGTLFHLFIFLVHGLPTFAISMMACLVIYTFKTEFNFKTNTNLILQLCKQILKLK